MSPRTTGPYTIAAVSKLTGISCHALRAWERRYGFPIPCRSQSGHRRYDAAQVVQIRDVSAWIRRGRPIGEIMADLLAGRLPAPPAELPAVLEPAERPPIAELLAHLLRGDSPDVERVYARLIAPLGPAEIATRILEPCLVEIGERWFRGECDIAEEHHATLFVRRKLLGLFDAAQAANPTSGRRALLATLQGERHEGGLLIFGLLLELHGWRAILLGTDLPFAAVRDAVARWRADAVGISFALSRSINKRFRELAQLRDVPVFVGGRSILNYQGLAQRYGLIPLSGPAPAMLAPFVETVERRLRDQSGHPPSPQGP